MGHSVETDVGHGLDSTAQDQKGSLNKGYLMRQLVVVIFPTTSRKGEPIVCFLACWVYRIVNVRIFIQQ